MLQIVPSIPQGWAKVRLAAKAAKVPISRANSLIISGAVPVAVDGAGYMWVSVDSLRNGFSNAEHTL